jgi:hypothetical protein
MSCRREFGRALVRDEGIPNKFVGEGGCGGDVGRAGSLVDRWCGSRVG